MQFLSPIWLYCLVLPIILAVALGGIYHRNRRSWSAFVADSRLAKRLVQEDSVASWWITTSLILLGLIFLFLGLADPVNGKKVQEIPRSGKKIYLAVDLSRSMLVEDVAPNRLTKAKTLGVELIEAFPDEQIGIISFSGKAWLEAPLTSDHGVLIENLLELNEETVPYGGSDTAPLLELLIKMAKKNEAKPSEALVVFLSDGEFHKSLSLSNISKARNQGYQFHAIGIGTKSGGVVPDRRELDGMFRDRNGRTVNSSLKTEPLKQIASFGGGEAFFDNNFQIIPRLKNAIAGLQGQEVKVKSLVTYNHLYHYFLIPAIILFVLACISSKMFRLVKSLFTLVLIGLCLNPSELQAQGVLSSYREGNKSLENQQYDDAIIAYEKALPESKGENRLKIHFSKGTAEYKKENFRDAIQSFSESLLSESSELQSESHYNLGNVLFKNGEVNLESITKKKKASVKDIIENRAKVIEEWENSLGHYRGSLQLQPEHPHARDNYDYVKEKLEKLKQEQKDLIEMIQQMQQGEGNEEGDQSQDKGDKNGNQQGQPGSDGYTPDELREMLEEEKRRKEESGSGEEEEQQGGNEEQDDEGDGNQGEELDLPNQGQVGPEKAREMLEESSDLESGNLRTGRQRYFKSPLKDW